MMTYVVTRTIECDHPHCLQSISMNGPETTAEARNRGRIEDGWSKEGRKDFCRVHRTEKG
jgi:hypothetical protein